MKTLLRVLVVAASLVAAAVSTAAAQIPDSALAVSYGGQSLFRVNINAGAVWGGTYAGNSATGIPAEGSGTRMMWYPGKAAFRAGGINGTQWDDANIGNYSLAIGESVRASGDYAVALGLRSAAVNVSSFAVGEDNTASGYASVAMGYHAHTNARRGTFVFADNVTGGVQDSVRSSHVGQALWRLSCGMRIFTDQTLNNGVSFGGPAVNPNVCGSTSPYHNQSNAMISTSTGAYLHTNGTWTNASDVNRKHLFQDVRGEDVLARLRLLPVGSWSYRTEAPGVRHIGPMAQDFRAVFGLGDDDKVIGTVDADGVALAAAKALERRTAEQREEIRALRDENARQKAQIDEMQARLARIEALLQASAAPRR